MTTTDWRELCAELVAAADGYDSSNRIATGLDLLLDLLTTLNRARAALAQPEPEVVGPTDEELRELYPATMVDEEDAFAFARAVLARWGRPAPAPAGERQAAPVPVAVSERLPGAEDCDENGDCWFDTGGDVGWMLCDKVFGLRHGSRWWLPAHALPLPSGEVE